MRLGDLAKQVLKEVSVPASDDLRGKTWYHGTPLEAAEKIASSRVLKPAEVAKKANLAPQAGMVYLTSNLHEGLQYAIFRNGGSFYQSDPRMQQLDGKYGALVVISGDDLKNIEPDEDTVADILGHVDRKTNYFRPDSPYYDRMGDAAMGWLIYLAQKKAPSTYRSYVLNGDYDLGTKLGKVLMKYMTPAQKLQLVLEGGKLGNEGEIPVSEVWKIPFTAVWEIARKPETFRQFSERLL
jgi:hypothetical protein